MRAVVVLVLICLVLSGCTDAPTTGGTIDTPATEAAGPAAHVLRFDLDAPWHQVQWYNGTLPQEICDPWCDIVEVDVTAAFPPGVPTNISIEMRPQYESDMSWMSFGLDIVADDAEIHSIRSDEPAEEFPDSFLDATLTTWGPVRLTLSSLPPHRAETPYTLRLEASADPSVIPPGVPARFWLEPNATVAVEGGSYLLWHDGMAMDTEGAIHLAADARATEYILFSSEETRLNVTGDASGLTVPRTEVVFHDTVAGPAQGPQTDTWDLMEVPIRAGVFYERGASAPFAVGGTYETTLVGPDGATLQEDMWCGVCASATSGWRIGPILLLATGAYTIESDAVASPDVRVGLVTARFVPA